MTGTRQLALDLPHRPALGRDDFLVAACNADAVAWLDRWPDWPGPGLCLYGPAGCGKTHLLEVWRMRSAAAVMSADRLTDDNVLGLAAAGAVVLDDLGGLMDERVLLHLFNLLREGGGSLLMAARVPPREWSLQLPDLRSRLLSMPAVGVDAPDDELLAALFHKLFADRQTPVKEGVVDYMIRRIERSFATAQKVVSALDSEALAARKAVSIPMVRRILDDIEEAGCR